MERITETMIQLISSEVCGNALSLSADAPFTEKFLIDLLILSRKHNVAHIVASALMNNGFLDNGPQKGLFMNEIYTAVYSQEKMNESFADTCSALEKSKIPYIPLKGAVIRGLYPQPWMRTSCDIDILVKENDLKRAIKALVECGFTVKGGSKHDIVLSAGNGTVLELHYKLINNKRSPLYSKILKSVWKTAQPSGEGECSYKLSDEVFYYYHILHMAKHFRIGGCGIRPFIDLWLMNKDGKYSTEKVRDTLIKGKLLSFAEKSEKLSRIWFADEDHDEITLQMQAFIVEGGSFGSEKTRLMTDKQRAGGRLGYILSRIFVPYSYLKRDYPILKKYPILTPWYEFCRLFSLLFGDKKEFRKSRINNMNSVAANHKENINHLFESVGL